jgi:flavin reductase (DIM6/NTAB) family NADH-FMN oxidoreductase RutF
MSSEPISKFTRDELIALEKPYRRNLINCLSGFKSLCLLGSVNEAGGFNLALMSSVLHVGANPPLMGVLFRPDVVPRHSLSNLRATSFFTLNHVTADFYPKAHQTAARYPEEVSEFEAVGLTPELGSIHPAPYVQEAVVKIGLRAREEHRILLNQTILVVGEIVELHVPKASLGDDGFLDLESCGSLTVSGLDSYHRSQRLSRLSYPKPGQKAKELDLDGSSSKQDKIR